MKAPHPRSPGSAGLARLISAPSPQDPAGILHDYAPAHLVLLRSCRHNTRHVTPHVGITFDETPQEMPDMGTWGIRRNLKHPASRRSLTLLPLFYPFLHLFQTSSRPLPDLFYPVSILLLPSHYQSAHPRLNFKSKPRLMPRGLQGDCFFKITSLEINSLEIASLRPRTAVR